MRAVERAAGALYALRCLTVVIVRQIRTNLKETS